MEVHKDQFVDRLPLVEAAILEADFVSIDAEFTGQI